MAESNDAELEGAAQDFLNVVREGRSFSGHEHNCSFMNLGDGTFAESSAVTGFNLDDDGRGLGLVDWDQDGDLDVWVCNRNGPQTRLFLNQHQHSGHHLRLSLEGTDSNRDAIGARIIVESPDHPPIIRTMTAGDGFLSQSSKQLVIGLGEIERLDTIRIVWPGGATETFSIPNGRVDQHYRLVEGRGAAVVLNARKPIELAANKRPTAVERKAEFGAFSFSMIPLPVATYEDYSKQQQPIVSPRARLTLVTLWASWCQPCVTELAKFAQAENQLRERNIDVIALSVDALTETAAPGDDAQRLKQLKFPFRTGRAGASDLEKLQLLHDTIYELHTPLPVPTSFLVDRRGRVVAIYKGSVEPDQLLADLLRIRVETTEQWRQATLPFPGTWEMPPRRRHLFDFAMELAKRGYREESRMYVQQNREMFESHPRLRELVAIISGGDAPGRQSD